VNGILVARIGVPSIIATLATQFLWGGLTTVFSQGLSYALGEVDQYFLWHLLVGRVGAFPVQAFWALAVAAALYLVLNRHRFGEHLLFIGDNARVAEVVGVNVGRERTRAFVLMGVMAAFASVLLTFENRSFFNTQGGGYLLEVMAAVFIGGRRCSVARRPWSARSRARSSSAWWKPGWWRPACRDSGSAPWSASSSWRR